MKNLAFAFLFCLVARLAFEIHDLRHDHDQAEAKRKENDSKVTQQDQLTHELAGILRRLGVRVGRLEEKNSKGE